MFYLNVSLIQVSTIAGALITIFTLAKLVVNPFKTAMSKNNNTMKILQETLSNLTRDLKESQKDRENIHRILERHDTRIDNNREAIIRHEERLNKYIK